MLKRAVSSRPCGALLAGRQRLLTGKRSWPVAAGLILAALLGMDGVILTAFILGFPANEIVIPIARSNTSRKGRWSI